MPRRASLIASPTGLASARARRSSIRAWFSPKGLLKFWVRLETSKATGGVTGSPPARLSRLHRRLRLALDGARASTRNSMQRYQRLYLLPSYLLPSGPSARQLKPRTSFRWAFASASIPCGQLWQRPNGRTGAVLALRFGRRQVAALPRSVQFQ